MAYFLAYRTWADEILAPDLPEDMPWLLVCEFSDQSPHAIVACDLPEDSPLPDCLQPLDGALGRLLESAEGYPPALALARGDVRRRHNELRRSRQPIDAETFQRELGSILRHHFDRQPTTPYILAKATWDDAYRSAGCYYWLVGLDPQEGEVWWVSSDHFVYQDPIEAFEITADRLGTLPRMSYPTTP